VIQRNTANT